MFTIQKEKERLLFE